MARGTDGEARHRDQILAELDAVHDYYADTVTAWETVQVVGGEGTAGYLSWRSRLTNCFLPKEYLTVVAVVLRADSL